MQFNRKAYNELLEWKYERAGKTAMLIEGPRRVGKTTLAKAFAEREYDAHLVIDFTEASDEVREMFRSYRHNVDLFFRFLLTYYGVTLEPRRSLIVFDEVQRFPVAREFIKQLVADGRYDYLETGSLISIKKNVKDILIPSEEESMELCPLDFEEFLEAVGESSLAGLIRDAFKARSALPDALHRKAEMLFREYLLVGGMPQAVQEFIDTGDYGKVDVVKRQILKLYREDIEKFTNGEGNRVRAIFASIPGQLSKHEKRFVYSSLGPNERYRSLEVPFIWLDESRIVNLCRNATDPNIDLASSMEDSALKCYLCDTGLLVSHAFANRRKTPNEVYRSILFDKLELNEGMFCENAVAQQLRANGYALFFYSRYDNDNARNTMEVDFLIVREYENAGLKARVSPVEVKSTKNYRTASLDKFKAKFDKRVGTQYVLHPKNLLVKGERTYLPLYMTFCL